MSEKKTVLGLALVFTVMTGLLAVLRLFPSLIVYRNSIKENDILIFTLLFIVLPLCLTIIFYILNIKQGQGLKRIFKNHIVRKTVGILAITTALLNFPITTLPLISSLRSLKRMNDEFVITSTVLESLNMLLIIVLLLFGVYLLMKRSRNKMDSEETKRIMGIPLLYTFITGIASLISLFFRMFGKTNIVYNLIQIAVNICIPLILYLIFTKRLKYNLEALKDNTISHSVGALLVIAGIFRLVPQIIGFVLYFFTYYSLYKTSPDIIFNLAQNNLNYEIIITLMLAQISYGRHLLRYEKKAENTEAEG